MNSHPPMLPGNDSIFIATVTRRIREIRRFRRLNPIPAEALAVNHQRTP